MESLTIQQLTTVAGVAIATNLVCLVIWRTAAVSDAFKSRFGPIIALGVGLVLAVVAGVLLDQARLDLIQSGVNGILGGLSAMGLYDVASSKAGVAP